MWRHEIKNYKTEKQFEKHRQVLIDLKAYYLRSMEQSSKSVKNLDKERAELEKAYRIWKYKKAHGIDIRTKRSNREMNSKKLWGAQLRAKIQNYVRENGEVTRKEIIEHCGKEADRQIQVLVERGGLIRARRGVYCWQEQKVKVI